MNQNIRYMYSIIYVYLWNHQKKTHSVLWNLSENLITQMFVSSKHGDRARADYFHFTSMDFDVSMPYALFLLGGQM